MPFLHCFFTCVGFFLSSHFMFTLVLCWWGSHLGFFFFGGVGTMCQGCSIQVDGTRDLVGEGGDEGVVVSFRG